jgi:hypothetical protein
MYRRGFVRVAALGALGALFSKQALASVSRAVPLEALTQRSQHVFLGEPLDAYAVWERIGGRKHIVTYTRVRAHELLSGADPKQDELLVRTLGGTVGELGELVHGEAVLQVGHRSVMFVMPNRDALAVTAMAQGHYPLRRDGAGLERLLRSPHATELIGEAGAAVKRLPGLQVPEARSLLQQVVRK